MIFPLSVLVYVVLLLIGFYNYYTAGKNLLLGRCLLAVCFGVIIFIAVLIGFVYFAFEAPNDNLYTILILAGGIVLELLLICGLWNKLRKKTLSVPLLAMLVICILTMLGYTGYLNYEESIPTVSESDNLLYSYTPNEENSKVAELGEDSTLKITSDIPRLDGATALYPIYAAFAQAVYPENAAKGANSVEETNALYCNTTTGAYDAIVLGDADIIFVASPSEEQKQFAEENGVELVYTPIGREAFVFFVNTNNPLENITIEEIQKIYSGEITEWKTLGVDGLGKIKAFQRDEGSGSQSALQRLMGAVPLMTPPKEDVVNGMGGIITKTADYKNFKNAIGYSFRFYSAEMVQNNQIKLLRVNDVEPSLENIENGTYPIASEFFAVTRSDASENTKKLLEWIQGEQGQRLVELTGYTPAKK